MPKVGMGPIRRAEAINAALECMYDLGVDQITLEIVAARAGFSKGVVAYYFQTKKQLILESLKALLSAYQRKAMGAISPDMDPLDMLRVVVETSLPPMIEETGRLNVSEAGDEADPISLPEQKVDRLFIQFLSKATTDPELMEVLRAGYASDVESVAALLGAVKKSRPSLNLNENEAAYSLMAMIYGLSLFRGARFLPAGKNDNRQAALDLIAGWFQNNPENKEAKP